MNICGDGVCVCDNYVYGEDGCSDSRKPFVSQTPAWRRYYMDEDLRIVFSINSPDEVKPGVWYYMDPGLRLLDPNLALALYLE